MPKRLVALCLSAPYAMYGADAYDTLSITLETYRLLHYLDNDHPIPKALKFEDFNEIDGIDDKAEPAIGNHSIALTAGLITCAIVQSQQRAPTRFVDPISATLGLKLLEAGSATVATFLTFGGVYWVLRNFFTSDLKHQFDELKRDVKKHKEQVNADITDIKKTVKDWAKTIDQTHTTVMGNLGRQQQLLKELQKTDPGNKTLNTLIQSTQETEQTLYDIRQAAPGALGHKKKHHNLIRWILKRVGLAHS